MKKRVCLILIMAQAIAFNVSAQQGQALNFSNTANTNIILATNIQLLDSFTIETWIYPEQKADFATIIGNKSPGIASPGYFFAVNTYATSDGRLMFETQNSNNATINSVTWNQWQHVAITWNGSLMRMYINGVWQAITDSINTNLQFSPSPCYVGDIPAYLGNGNFLGNMDELRVWNYARSQQEIADRMFCQLSNAEPGLITYYQFNEGIAAGANAGITILPDMSGSNNTGTLVNFGLNGGTTNWIAPGGVSTITSLQNIETCQGNSITIGTNVYTTDGTYFDTLTATNGCDSLLTTNLIFNALNNMAQSFTMCNGDSIVVGDSTYYTGGVFTNQFLNMHGCDSIIETTINLSIPNVNVLQVGNTLVADPGATSYQWIYCDSLNTVVTNETNANFSPFIDGTYAVMVTQGTCTSISVCYPMILTAIKENVNPRMNLAPNPANEFIVLNQVKQGETYRITTVEGVLVSTGKFINQTTRIDISHLNAGMYYICSTSGQTNSFVKY